MWWNKNRQKDDTRELLSRISNLETEVKRYRDNLKILKSDISVLESYLDGKIKKVVKDEILQMEKSEVEVFEKNKNNYREMTNNMLEDEIIELRRRLIIYIEKNQVPFDHYELALINYRDIDIPLKAQRVNQYDRYAMQKLLPHEVKKSKTCLKWLEIQRRFGYRCALTGNENYEFEHFIPLHTGHGGAYEGNIIPMSSNLNSRKGNKNPFQWFKLLNQSGKHNAIFLKRWDELIEYLAAKNNLNVEEYIDFVNWCFSNPRTKEQLEMFDTPSIELWKYSKIIIN